MEANSQNNCTAELDSTRAATVKLMLRISANANAATSSNKITKSSQMLYLQKKKGKHKADRSMWMVSQSSGDFNAE